MTQIIQLGAYRPYVAPPSVNDEAVIEAEIAANRAASEAARAEVAARMAAAYDARMARRARPVDELPGADLWQEFNEFQSEFQDQGRITDGDRFSAVENEIEHRLLAFDQGIIGGDD